MTEVIEINHRPAIVVCVKASTYSGPYRLEWDWECCRWNQFDEPGEPLGIKALQR